MKKLFLYASLICMGMTSCSKDYFVPEDELPSWLGESIYEELKNPKTLTGTFNTYMKLIEDLGYTEVLSKTGSKTIFPANDEAFAAFFANGNNKFGVSSYEQLTEAQKAQLLYSTMLDNAILVGMLSNDENMIQGQIVKHPTNISLVQSVTPLFSQNMPANNKYFAKWKDAGKSFNALYDNTESPMVHFTGEYLLNNDMTVVGEDNDFYVLTGEEYKDGDVYVYNRKVINSNVTCQNGYIHQLDSVLLNPGNMAQILREGNDTRKISRILDYYSAPFKVSDKLQADYFEYTKAYGTQDSVYAIRYFSKNSQRAKLSQYTGEGPKNDQQLLNFDPGWNNYNPTLTGGTSSDQDEIAAMLIPTDDVVEDYFLTDGKYIVENLGAPNLPISKETLDEHLDSIFKTDPTVFAGMLNNIMHPYLTKTVPSKFSTVQNDAFEFMNLTKNDLKRKANGKYDVVIGNNGVIYKTNKFFAPELYNSVLGPASVYTDMRIMSEMLNDHQITAGTPSKLGADMYYYLLSMKSKYAMFIPFDGEEFFYFDPATVNDIDGMKALKFYYDPAATGAFHVMVQRYIYNEATGTLSRDESVGPVNIGDGYFNSQIQDMLNYHTVVLPSSQEGLYGNQYYMTKHGGAIFVEDGTASHDGQSQVKGGIQINNSNIQGATVLERFYKNGPKANITNGTVYKLNSPIQPTVDNVYKVLSTNEDFAEFYQFCANFNDTEALIFAGIISTDDTEAVVNQKRKQYVVFGDNNIVNMFGSYNYTLYVPMNMQKAYDNGLPKWEDVKRIVEAWTNAGEGDTNLEGYATEEEAKSAVKAMIEKMRNFVLYHMQNNSVFADKVVESNTYQTFSTDNLGIAKKISVSGGNGELIITDANGAHPVIVKNILARDTKVEEKTNGKDASGTAFTYKTITSSAFVTIHGIEEPLSSEAYSN